MDYLTPSEPKYIDLHPHMDGTKGIYNPILSGIPFKYKDGLFRLSIIECDSRFGPVFGIDKWDSSENKFKRYPRTGWYLNSIEDNHTKLHMDYPHWYLIVPPRALREIKRKVTSFYINEN